MQLYTITDGKNYIRKVSGNYVKCTCPTMAGKWSFRDAEKILENNLSKDCKKDFYLEGVDDLVPLNQDVMDKHLRKEEFERHSYKDIPLQKNDLELIENYISSVSSIQQISREKLMCMKTNFKSNVMLYDNQLEDIKHWILTRNPPVYMYPYIGMRLYRIIKERARVKQAINYIDGLIKAYEKNFPFSQLLFEVKEREYKEYKPRTKVFKELDTYYNEKMKKGKKKI